jgi:8-oxo-dGTP diphosphatase
MKNKDFHYDQDIRIDNKRVAAIILKDDLVLLMYRFKNGKEFYTFPGGHMQENEEALTTLAREIFEETSLTFIDPRPAFTLIDHAKNKIDYYFVVTSCPGVESLGGEESEKNSQDNTYRLEWIKLFELEKVNVLPRAAKEWVIETLINK